MVPHLLCRSSLGSLETLQKISLIMVEQEISTCEVAGYTIVLLRRTEKICPNIQTIAALCLSCKLAAKFELKNFEKVYKDGNSFYTNTRISNPVGFGFINFGFFKERRISRKFAKPSAFWSRIRKPSKATKPAVFKISGSIKYECLVF